MKTLATMTAAEKKSLDEDLIRTLSALCERHGLKPHVLVAVADMEDGVTARSTFLTSVSTPVVARWLANELRAVTGEAPTRTYIRERAK